MNFPTQWHSDSLAGKNYKKFEEIRLNESEQNSIEDLKSLLKPFLEITELLKERSYCIYSMMNSVLLEMKNNFCTESMNTLVINFENEESAFDRDNRKIQINGHVNCTGLIDKIKLNLFLFHVNVI